jgi:hypothetical protein
LIRLEYADAVVSELRKSTRYAVALAFTVEVDGKTYEVTSKNLSLGGAALELDERLAVGSQAKVRFRVPGHAEAIQVDAEVRWSHDREIGVAFGGLRAREVWELNRYFGTLPR